MVKAARCFGSDREGAVAALIALCFVALAASAAMAVDLGSVFTRSRLLQGMADLAAISAVQALGAGASSTPQAAAAATVAVNAWPGPVQTQAVLGVYTPDPSLPPARRFTPTTVGANAVQVTLSGPAPLFFAGMLIGRNSMQVQRQAVASLAQYAAFSIDSRLLAFNGGLANALLSALTGSQVALTVMDDQALASARVDLLDYLPALRTEAGLTAASFSQTLGASIAPPAALNAMADVLDGAGEGAAATAARKLALASTGLPAISLASLIDLGPYGAQDHGLSAGQARVEVGALDMAQALLTTADAGRQLTLALDAAPLGLAKLNLTLAIGQRPGGSPWLTLTDVGTVIVRTAQTRLLLDAQLLPAGLGAAASASLLDLPIFVELASAQARLQSLDCTGAGGFTLAVSPSVGSIALAQVGLSTLNDFTKPASLSPAVLLNTLLLKVTAFSRIDIGGGQAGWTSVAFTQADVQAGTTRTVTTPDVARASVASLLSTTQLQVGGPAGGVAVGAGALSPTLSALLTGAAPALDGVINAVEALSGAHLGQANVSADGLRCAGAALVA